MEATGRSNNKSAAEPCAAHCSLNTAVATEHLHVRQTLDAVGAKPQVKHGFICTVMLDTGGHLNQANFWLESATNKPRSKSGQA